MPVKKLLIDESTVTLCAQPKSKESDFCTYTVVHTPHEHT